MELEGIHSSNFIKLSIANLSLRLDLHDSGFNTSVHECHKKFLNTRPSVDDLVFSVQNGVTKHQADWNPIYYPSNTWELWKDKALSLIFVAPPSSPPQRLVFVDQFFTSGKVVGDFQSSSKNGFIQYPLQDIDLVLFVNWLSIFGDLVLHASGIQVDGKGYCFIGFSGAGKSTIVKDMASIPGVEILGEDNLVLRLIDGKYWIFGTPWHLNPAMCSAKGVPLEKMFFLDRSKPRGLEKCSPSEGITKLLQTAFIPYYNNSVIPGILDQLGNLSQTVPFSWLSYQRGTDVLQLIVDFELLTPIR